MKITALSPLIAICVGVWAIVNAIFPFVAVINERRDTVLTGCLAGVLITHDHRVLIMSNDYFVMSVSMILLLIGIGTFVCFLPRLISTLKSGDAKSPIKLSGYVEFVMICIGLGLIGAAFVWAVSVFYEHAAMQTVLDNSVNVKNTCK